MNETERSGGLVPIGSNAIVVAPQRSKLILSGIVADTLAVAKAGPAWTVFMAIVAGHPPGREFFHGFLAQELWGKRYDPRLSYVQKGSEIVAVAGRGPIHLICLNLDHLEWDLENGGRPFADEDIFNYLSRRYLNVPVIGYRKPSGEGPPEAVHPWHGVPLSTMEIFRQAVHDAVARGFPQT